MREIELMKFSKEEIEEGSLMVSYNAATSFKQRFAFIFNEKIYVVYDQHCKHFECTCKVAAIDFVGTDADYTHTGEVLFFKYDYGIRQITETSGDIPAQLEAQLAANDEFNKRLELRNHALKRAFQSHIWQMEAAQLKNSLEKSLDKINRNAPCPCGSGKKYKKCCGIAKY